MSQIETTKTLDQLIEENKDLLNKVISIAKQYYEHFFILINLPRTSKTHVITQQLSIDITAVFVEPLDSSAEAQKSFQNEILKHGDAIYIYELSMLIRKSKFNTPNMNLLLNSKLVFSTDEEIKRLYYQKQKEANKIIDSPFTKQDYDKAFEYVKYAEHQFSLCITGENFLNVRKASANFLSNIEDGLMMLNKTYWHKNFRYQLEELGSLTYKPENLLQLIDNLISAPTIATIQEAATVLLREVYQTFEVVKKSIPRSKKNLDSNEKLEDFQRDYNLAKQKFQQLKAFKTNKHMMFMTLLDVSVICENNCDGLLRDELMTKWKCEIVD